MKAPYSIKWAWLLLAVILVASVLGSILLVSLYRNKVKTTVEPIQSSGTYQRENGEEPQPLANNTYIDACENSSVTFRGSFGQEMKEDVQVLFFIKYLEVHIYLNGDEIHAWGTENMDPSFMRSAGAAWGYC